MLGTAWIEALAQDLRFAGRQLRRTPGFTAIAALTLALGVGANTAIFSVVNGVLLRPLPYAHADRLVSLRERNGPRDDNGMVVSWGNFAVWRERAHAFQSFAAWHGGSFTLTGAGLPQQISPLFVNAEYWRTLYLPPAIGRYFTPGEDQPGVPRVVVLSYSLWQSAFGGDRAVVGRTITLSGTPYTVVGVASPEYATTSHNDLWVPLVLDAQQTGNHADHELAVVGLLRPGVTREAAVRELTGIETELAREYPHANFDGAILDRSMRETVVGPVRPQVLLLYGAVTLVLLIACANLANLLLARGAARRKELAIRSALGAGRSRIAFQVIAESLVLGLAGSLLGLALATEGVRFLATFAPPGTLRMQQVTIDGGVIAFAVVVAILSSVLAALVPALRGARTALQGTLREGSRHGGGPIPLRLRSALVVGEIAVALTLLLGAGLLVRSALLLERAPLGFDAPDLTVTSTLLPESRYPTPTATQLEFERIRAAVAAIPGVQSAALVSRIPVGSFGYDCGARAEGADVEHEFDANVRVASPNYFATLGLPLRAGRTFGPGDVAGAAPVVIVNAALAHRLFGDANPIGRRLSHCDGDTPVWRTVIGVTGDMHASGPGDPVSNEVYYPEAQHDARSQFLVVRGRIPALQLAPEIRRTVASMDPLLALSPVSTMEDILASYLAGPRFIAMLLSLLSLLGLVLAAVGIYGVIAFLVQQQTQEIGIRMALGSEQRWVVRMVVGRGVVLAGIGVAVGLPIALLASGVLRSLLYGVGAHDPLTLVGVCALLIGVGALASFLPAQRAAAIDPMLALRAE